MLKNILFSTILIFLLSNQIKAQVTVTGVLEGDDGSPIPGVTVQVKGTTVATMSDADGYYSIDVPEGSTILVFSYVGMQTQEAEVADLLIEDQFIEEENTDIEIKKNPFKLIRRGIAKVEDINYFIDKRYTYSVSENINIVRRIKNKKISFPSFISKIRYRPRYKNFIVESKSPSDDKLLNIQYLSSLDYLSPNKLPELQERFAQGNISLYNPNSIFSFGPNISSLEYDGIYNPYDINGNIVSAGTGNDVKANVYNPYDFFKTGICTKNIIKVSIGKYRNRNIISLSYRNNETSGIVPLSRKSSNMADLIFTHNHYRFSSKIYVKYIDIRSNFPEISSNYSRLFHSITTTPISFDNSNNMKTGKAAVNSLSYLTETGTNRSYLPDDAFNPYWLINNNFDYNSYKRFVTKFELNYKKRDFELKYSGAFNSVVENIESGYYLFNNFTDGFLSKKNFNKKYYFSDIKLKYFWFNKSDFELSQELSYKLNSENITNNGTYRNLSNFIDNPETEIFNTLPSSRLSNEIYLRNNLTTMLGSYRNGKINVLFNGLIYNSNTLEKKKIYFLPHIQLLYEKDWNPKISVYTSYSEVVKEYPAHLAKLSSNTLLYNSRDFNSYNEYVYPQLSENMVPERIKKYNLSILGQYRFISGFINFHKDWCENAIFQTYENSIIIKNAANYNISSWETGFKIKDHFHNSKWEISFSATFPKTKVSNVHSEKIRLPYAGFSNISLNLIEGQPLGVIVGNSYQRDNLGNKIIGDDGYPLVEDSLKVIGNPNPDFILDIYTEFEYKGFNFNAIFEYKKGGEIWNGTSNALDYYGKSTSTGDQRNIQNYIFEGVNENGETNNIPVTIESDRWTRYGFAGISEEAIQDASCFRLKEIRFGYNFATYIGLHKTDISISVWAKNIILKTKYKGVDPETALFGYENTQSLDLFNMPALKSFGISINFKF